MLDRQWENLLTKRDNCVTNNGKKSVVPRMFRERGGKKTKFAVGSPDGKEIQRYAAKNRQGRKNAKQIGRDGRQLFFKRRKLRESYSRPRYLQQSGKMEQR